MLKAYKYRIYPEKSQEEFFEKTFGCCRFVWNKMLEEKLEALRQGRKVPRITPARYKKEYPFVREVDSLALANVQLEQEKSFRDHFKNPKHFRMPNQKIHQWCFRKMVEMITYKAQLLGIEVELVPEEYTSQVCPVCGSKNRPIGRNYECRSCGFRYHRDGVGAINIWQRYLGRESQVVAGLAPVRGVRFKPHLCGHGVSNAPWKAA
ncbi:transposase, IS605 OrfB family, central region [Caldicellulosiruptor bescii]|nr:transposase, IS605 OrfB family, central region [Caldicellulosiruptor bescii]